MKVSFLVFFPSSTPQDSHSPPQASLVLQMVSRIRCIRGTNVSEANLKTPPKVSVGHNTSPSTLLGHLMGIICKMGTPPDRHHLILCDHHSQWCHCLDQISARRASISFLPRSPSTHITPTFRPCFATSSRFCSPAQFFFYWSTTAMLSLSSTLNPTL